MRRAPHPGPRTNRINWLSLAVAVLSQQLKTIKVARFRFQAARAIIMLIATNNCCVVWECRLVRTFGSKPSSLRRHIARGHPCQAAWRFQIQKSQDFAVFNFGNRCIWRSQRTKQCRNRAAPPIAFHHTPIAPQPDRAHRARANSLFFLT